MTWTRLSDEFCDRAEVASLSDAAFRAHVEALVYCNRVLTDGRLPKSVVGRVLTRSTWRVFAELVKAGLWAEEPEYFAVDWRDQLGAEEVEQRRALDRERRERSRRHKSGDHTMCRPSYCARATRDETRDGTGDGTGDETRDGTRDETRESRRDGRSPVPPVPPVPPDPPGPSRPLGREGGKEGEAGERPDGVGAPLAVPREETRGNQAPPEPPDDPEQRLGRKRHPWAPDCCALADWPENPIHDTEGAS